MLSIIIPCLNEEKYLPKLLQSVKEQDCYIEAEIIVADAGSKDKSCEIARKFEAKIVKGGLPAKSRNEGAKIAKGDLLLFIDADIYLPKNFFRQVLKEFSDRQLGVASFTFAPDDQRFIFRLIFGAYNFWMKTFHFGHAYMGTVLVKKKIHERVKGFDETIKLAEDHLYARQAKKFGKYGAIKSVKLCGSARRFKKDGTLLTCGKYILAGFYIFFFGPIKKDIFKYKFNHYDDN